MKAKILAACLGGALLLGAADVPAADKNQKPSDSDKLKIRDLQFTENAAGRDMMKLESQWKDLATVFQKYKAAEDEAVAELGKRLGCEIDAQTLECKPKAPAAKPTEPPKAVK